MIQVAVLLIVLNMMLGFFYLSYRLLIVFANRIVKSELRKELIHGELEKDKGKLALKLRDWFNWTLQVNYEKGTAGGNIKINFPVKSALGLALVCLIIAALLWMIPFTVFIVPMIFFSFSVYHFLRWYRALNAIKQINKTTPSPNQNNNIQA